MDDTDWTPDFGTLDKPAPTWAAKRPVRIAVLGDFSGGAARGRLQTGADLARRKMVSVEFDNLEETLARAQVKLALSLAEGEGGEGAGAGVEIEFAELDAFHPDALYRELEVFKALADLRKRLNNSATFAKAAAEVQAMSGAGKPVSKSRRKRSRGAAPAAGGKLSDFARLTGIAPQVQTDAPVDEMLRRIVGPFVVAAPDPKRDVLVASVDRALSDAMRAVLHRSEFQNLEALWRGMDLLLRRVETSTALQVLLVDISAEELAADLSSTGNLADTGLYSMLVDKPSHDKTGGLSLICGLYNFEATPPHAELLGRMAKIAAQAGAPFVTAINAEPFMDRKKPAHPLMLRALRELRALPEASHLALLSPRFMLRHPYGKRTDPIDSFDFEEFTAADGLRGMLWAHPALLAACLLAAPVGRTLSIGELPFHYFVDAEGDQIALPCTERFVDSDAAARLRGLGIVALMAHKGQPELRFAGLDAVNGQTIALQGMPKPVARSSVTTAVQGRIAGGAVAAPAKASAGADDTSDEAVESNSSDGGLDDLLAGLGGDDSSSDASIDMPSDTSSDSADEAPADAGADTEMDPELAALLKSLE